jgi:hypothetical protein
MTLTDPTILPGNLKTQVFLHGGVVGKTYTVRNRMQTNSTPIVGDDRSFFVRVKER